MIELLNLIGSAFVKQTKEGKTQVALGPFAVVGYALTGAACYAQDSEPFSQCVNKVWPLIGGLF